MELFLPVVIDLAEGVADKGWNGLTAAKHHIREITPRADGRVDQKLLVYQATVFNVRFAVAVPLLHSALGVERGPHTVPYV